MLTLVVWDSNKLACTRHLLLINLPHYLMGLGPNTKKIETNLPNIQEKFGEIFGKILGSPVTLLIAQ